MDNDNSLPAAGNDEWINVNTPANPNDIKTQEGSKSFFGTLFNHTERLQDKLLDAGEFKIDKAINESYRDKSTNAPLTGQGADPVSGAVQAFATKHFVAVIIAATLGVFLIIFGLAAR